ncbi:DUF6252 family protein [uncultured Lacinutrix sp.]|uniref:DUF6252 family protein n=1 Tax=uncultured Lacinutrix sp. TaxID=574032 RepID=UPI002636268A|nr:DUF6252 family protein [uncultured Lacinutrix sp.]
MKKIIVLALTVFTFFGCGDDVEFNTPAFKANKDGNLWEGVSYSANIDGSGVITIVGSDNFETVTLVAFPSDAFVCDTKPETVYGNTPGNCYEVSNNPSFATLLDVNDVFWSTNNTPASSEYPADGVINIRELSVEEGLVSGAFYFNAFNSSGLSSVNFKDGFFHNIPLVAVTATPGPVDPCTTATATVAATLVNYNAAMPGDANYETVCNAYKTALGTQITECGDADGSIQTTIDGLMCM